MPTIGWFEILIVIIVAIIVIGPKDFPFMIKKVGSWIGSIKKYISNIQNEIADINIDTDIDEIKNSKENLVSLSLGLPK